MTYKVIYSDNARAETSAQAAYMRAEQVGEEVMANWFERLFDAIENLYEWPKRYPIDQQQTQERGFEVRKMVFGHYLIFYRVEEESRTVEVFSFIHGASRRNA